MPDRIRFLDLGTIPAPRTQSIYHAVAEEMGDDSPDTIIFCRPSSAYVCVGFHQPADAVLDLPACARLGLPVFRRHVGGGTTLLDSEQFFYQCIFHHKRMPSFFRAIFQQLLRPPVQALCSLGLNASLDEVNEIRVNGIRIAGTGGGLIGEACVVVGNILFDFDHFRMAQIWRVPSEPCRELAHAALCANVTTLRDLDKSVSKRELARLLAVAYAQYLRRPLEEGELTQRELGRAEALDAELQSDEFVGMREHRAGDHWGPLKISAGAYIQADQAHVNGGVVDGCFWVQEGVIRRAILSPDPWEPFSKQLCGIPYSDWQSHILSFGQAQRA